MNDLQGLVEQCQRDTHRWFPKVGSDIRYLALSLAGEAGEVAEHAKKVWRGSKTLDEVRADMGEEAVDVLIYLCCLFAELGVDPVEIYTEKRAKNELRFGRPGAGLPDGRSSEAATAHWDARAELDPADYYGSRGA